MVRRKWTFNQQPFIPRRKSDPALVAVFLRRASANPTWGYSRLHGQLLKLGYKIGRSTVRDILKRDHVPPAPERAKRGSNWRTFLDHYADQICTCAFFKVETAWLKTLCVFFCIELGS